MTACKREAELPVTEVPPDILVRVADRTVTSDDLDGALNRMLGAAAFMADDQAAKNALESLVSLHAIAALQEKAMSADELRELDRRVFHYREDLLMRAYVGERAQGLVVSPEEIQAFYDQHPETYGGGEKRRFETLAVASAQDEAAARALQEAVATADWAALADGSRGQLLHARATTDGPELQASVAAAVGSLEPGAASDVLVVDGALLRLRVTEVVPVPPRPLPEVREAVREAVAARKTRDKIRELAAEARAKTQIEYLRSGAAE